MDWLASLVAVGVLATPFLLVAALIRGGLRGRRERAAAKWNVGEFE